MQNKQWVVYLLTCSDGTIYTGITNDINKRIRAHNGLIKGGAKYTSKRRPVVLLKFFECDSKSSALKIEYKIKKLSRAQKINLSNIDKFVAELNARKI